jgi:hypothetical protein
MNAFQNYPLLKGQQTNLYKCVLENGFNWMSKYGFMGLIHPEGVYDDPKGQPLRKEIYQRLQYHFQFQNAFNLFAEVAHREKYGAHIYSGNMKEPNFISINNLFHPMTIDGCFIGKSIGAPDGIKFKDEKTESFVWNTKSHLSRKINYTENELKILAKTFEDSVEWETAKLVSIHSYEILNILKKLGEVSQTIGDYNTKISEGWHETNDQNEGKISRSTKYPNYNNYEMIYSGPHFFVSNPLYKNPREQCTEKSHYDIIDLNEIDENYIARTNYIPENVGNDYSKIIPAFEIGKDHSGKPIYDSWFSFYKIGFRKMLGQPNERTLFPAILPPKSAHIHGVISLTFKDESKMLEAMSIVSSLVLDFFIKTVGSANLSDGRIQAFPIGIREDILQSLNLRTLRLNCVTGLYKDLWERNWNSRFTNESWSAVDVRLSEFKILNNEWDKNVPLRNWFERRRAMIEVDVLVAMAFGLNVDELALMYNVQFPVLQQNEDDTWYDTKGNIVFTCSKGLNGVGLDRPVWNTIKDLKAGETYEHTIEKSELYHGKKVIYYAPFDKCDRVEDYKTAWAHFETIFKEN